MRDKEISCSIAKKLRFFTITEANAEMLLQLRFRFNQAGLHRPDRFSGHSYRVSRPSFRVPRIRSTPASIAIRSSCPRAP